MIEGELFTVFSLVAVLAASNGRDGGSVCLTVDTFVFVVSRCSD